MRRFIAYIALTAASILGVGAAIAPTALRMDTDLAYGDGQTLYFRASRYDAESDNGNYGYGQSHDFLPYEENASKQTVDYIAATMRTRLDGWGVSGYQVAVEGSDTIAVSLRTPKENKQQSEYLKNILTFNGGDYDLDAQDVTKEGYAHPDTLSSILDGQVAEIVDIEQQGYKVPVVIVPLKEGNDYKTDFLNLIEYCTKDSGEKKEGEEEQSTGVPLLLWANRLEADTYALSQKDPNIASRIVFTENAGNAVYYASSDTEKEKPYLQIIPYSEATAGESYDPSKTQEAYDAARYMKTMINSGVYEYDEIKEGNEKIRFNLSFLYSKACAASVENLIALDWNPGLTMSKTLIAFLVTFAFIALSLILFERWLAAIPLVSTLLTGFSAFACFVAFGAQFNVAAVIGLAAGSLVGLFGSLFYTARLREELYKGRTPKKAHNEAAKRALLPSVDAGVISILIGVCVYGLGGDVASKAGLMLVLCGFLGIVASTLFPRILGWLICNDSTVASSFYGYFNVRKERVPDLLKEEKPSYFGPYAQKDFTKGKKWVGIVSLLFLLAGTGSMIGWGIVNNGSFFNSSASSNSNTSLRIEVRSASAKAIDLPSFSDTGKLLDVSYDPAKAPTDIFHFYKLNGKTLADYTANLTLSADPKSVYEGQGEGGSTYYWFYYEARLISPLALLENGNPVNYEVMKWDGTAYVKDESILTLSDLAADIIDEFSPTVGTSNGYNGAKSERVVIAFDPVKPEALTPYFYQVALGVGIGLASSLVYLALRYRPSRGIALGLVGAGASFIGVSFFALTRIATSPVVALGAVFVAVSALIAGLYVLAGEKEYARDSKEKDRKSLEFRSLALKEANSRQAGNVLVLFLILAYVAIAFFAFGPTQYATAFLAAILGIAFSLAMVLALVPDCAILFAKGFSKIRIGKPSLKKLTKKAEPKKGGQLMKKKASAEPEEAIFIGIND